MSRSYRHTPIIKDNKHGRKWCKKYANDNVRIYKELVNGKMYRKVFNTWNIYDYSCRFTQQRYIAWHIERNEYYKMQGRNIECYNKTEQELKNEWKVQYYWK